MTTILPLGVRSGPHLSLARRALLCVKVLISVIERVKVDTALLALTIVLNLQFQILVVLHALALALSNLVYLLLVHDLRDLVGAAHLLLDLKVSRVHALATSSLNCLVGGHQLLVIIARLVLTNDLSKVFVRMECSVMRLTV